VGGPSPEVPISVEGSPTYFRRHASSLGDERAGFAWIGASGVEGARTITVTLGRDEEGASEGTGIRVAHKADDAEESASGAMNLASSDLELTTEETNQSVGIRFANLAIPRGSVIKSATIQFTADEPTTRTTWLAIYGQAADDAPPFTAAPHDISSRPKTAAFAVWRPDPWKKAGSAGPRQRTPDLHGILQEIVNRPGWHEGGAVAFLITGSGKRVARAFDKYPREAPRLNLALANPRPTAAGSAGSPDGTYTVRLYFAEPDERMEPGARIFRVDLQGETVLESLDIAAQTGRARRTLVKEFHGVDARSAVTITLTPLATRAAVLSGIEIIASQSAAMLR
jgi:hypothetical protein